MSAYSTCPYANSNSPAPLAPNVLPRQPPLAVKPSLNVASTGAEITSTPCSMMSKEWVVPPRPKPGRKPATDTPPTKRKAQNRAAQRAFRERRAARVSELEEQMRQVEEEHNREVSNLKSQIDALQVQLQQYRNETGWWEKRCQNLEAELQVERNAKEALVKAREEEKQKQHAREASVRQQTQTPVKETASPAQSHHQLPQASVLAQSTMTVEMSNQKDQDDDCNTCSLERCKCINDAFNIPEAISNSTDHFSEIVPREPQSNTVVDRRASNSVTPTQQQYQQQTQQESKQQQSQQIHQTQQQQQQTDSEKQQNKQETQVKCEYDEMEIDFTEQFSTKRPPPQQQPKQQRDEDMFTSAPPLFETCGFCQDGTPCLCAEMAAEEQQQRQQQQQRNRQMALHDLEKAEQARLAASSDRCVKSRMPTIQSLSHMTPPPSESDVFSESLPPISALTRESLSACGENGPGTCLQCQSDPRSTLFCKSLAAARVMNSANNNNNNSRSGCCGGGGGGGSGGGRNGAGYGRAGGCCKDIGNRDPTAAPPLTLSCADTFTTLSRHPQFSRATDELDAWMPRLVTLPNPAHLAGAGGANGAGMGERPAMEVEAASVMNVLRYFDRRFSV
ncbi:bZIP family transcription factor [Ascosphaera apis ARSEF 7405]|uniref:BZIP family transcription factor n=1 Tax=Ascosphaera apis ARSEF 7405 TaxID=392613 RepID=A0A166P8N9_9EURO|nr:bZIP family transcription factor [Ascosphaera apis ARSEF 7405]